MYQKMGVCRSALNFLAGKLAVKRPMGKSRCRCEDKSIRGINEHRLKVFENKIVRLPFGPKRDESGESFTVRNFIVCTILLTTSA